MNKLATVTGCLLILLTAGEVHTAAAQKATEIYIPVGQSPGLAGYTQIGTVTSLDMSEGTLTLTDTLEQVHTARLSDSTSIWLDRSLIKQQNMVVSVNDIEEGQRVEVKYYLAPDSTYLAVAEWIKIQVR
ncbi:DUF5666 domain-containing protein [Aliifodinibius sp. S!AR15-10]|uniref:DUF5666 domain-containing protein n=1 Tax=Aliifodinibius sp. S!AR15-10 TaxID=2950437 RepID=UPI0028578980|nr:DUF5666 domain-containing protein [Aliifodinibius sp. S!AR15-10]MDR8390816.1 DUF5666 domain-containing protein [Aliifodinibius sp. S!AR15-10]